ncbi:hypothetical protein B6N60_04710 [Richelia sinica FACHB-800]|uniref:Uncharacterized protein n=1 Tax=Richelia sinica FACHB-800 TaxID=1357546 RepID=A0A975TDC7_9NOST|nr:hypothetical protein [Richelia sinica]MBD2665072.1 hypothetical protein [Richelia sinica FACHB-800]QXE25988.1 hypothetical protein B6N60_04710 [Richelia sinica FACHB-800]
MFSVNLNLYLFLENLLFLLGATLVIFMMAWGWRNAQPYTLPLPFPGWYKIWFLSVQILGALVPFLVMVWWGLIKGEYRVLTILGWYFFNLGMQIISESLTLRKYQSIAWVMVPYIYLPYRFWQLYESWSILNREAELIWLQYLLLLEIVVWAINYLLDVSQLPRLWYWEAKAEGTGQ